MFRKKREKDTWGFSILKMRENMGWCAYQEGLTIWQGALGQLALLGLYFGGSGGEGASEECGDGPKGNEVS